MSPADAYLIRHEPFYQPQGNETELYAAAYAARLPVMLKVPTGCGKSRLVEAMAHELERPLVTVACNDETSAADLLGRWLVRGWACQKRWCLCVPGARQARWRGDQERGRRGRET